MKKIYVIQHNEIPSMFLDAYDCKEDALYALMSMDWNLGNPLNKKNREESMREYSIHEAEVNEEKVDCTFYVIMRNGDPTEYVPTLSDAEHDLLLYQKRYPKDELTIEKRTL